MIAREASTVERSVRDAAGQVPAQAEAPAPGEPQAADHRQDVAVVVQTVAPAPVDVLEP